VAETSIRISRPLNSPWFRLLIDDVFQDWTTPADAQKHLRGMLEGMLMGTTELLLRAEIRALRDVCEDALEFVRGYEDVVDGDYGQPAPNKAMRLAMNIKEALEGKRG